MSGKNGSDRPPEPSDEFVRAVARLEVGIGKLVESQRVTRDEVKALGGKIDTLSARVDGLAERVHRTNNLAQRFDEQYEILQRSQETMDRAVDFFEVTTKARAFEFERSLAAINAAVQVLEGRMRHVRDEVADLRAGESERET